MAGRTFDVFDSSATSPIASTSVGILPEIAPMVHVGGTGF